MRNRPIYDVVALLARCGVGIVFLAHGWQKIQVGVNVTGRNLDAMGAPLPTAAAVYSTFVELLGGAALILGLALPLAGLLLFVDMAGALIFVHAKHGLFLVHNGHVHNGFELVLVLGLVSLVFAVAGGGRLSLDHRFFGRTGFGRPDEEEEMMPWRPLPDAPEESPVVTPAGRRTGELPTLPDTEPGKKSGKSETEPAGPARPRLAADIVTDTSRDVIVAGKKPEPAADKTPPRKPRRKPPRSDS